MSGIRRIHTLCTSDRKSCRSSLRPGGGYLQEGMAFAMNAVTRFPEIVSTRFQAHFAALIALAQLEGARMASYTNRFCLRRQYLPLAYGRRNATARSRSPKYDPLCYGGLRRNQRPTPRSVSALPFCNCGIEWVLSNKLNVTDGFGGDRDARQRSEMASNYLPNCTQSFSGH